MTGNIRQALGLVAFAAALLLAGRDMSAAIGEVVTGLGTLLGVVALVWLGVTLVRPASAPVREPARD